MTETEKLRDYIERLYFGLVRLFPEYFFDQAELAEHVPVPYLLDGVVYKPETRQEYEKLILRLTESKNLTEAIEKLDKLRKEKELGATVPQNLKEQVDNLEKKEAAEKSSSPEETKESPKKAKEPKVKEEKEEVEAEPPLDQGRVIYLKQKTPPTTISISKEDAIKLSNMRVAAKTNPEEFSKSVYQRILKITLQHLQGPGFQLIAKAFAADFTNALTGEKIETDNLSWALATIADPKNPALASVIPNDKERLEISQSAQIMAISQEAYYEQRRHALGLSVNENEFVFGPARLEYEASQQKPAEPSLQINLDQFKTAYQVYKDTLSPLLETINSGNSAKVAAAGAKLFKLNPAGEVAIRKGVLGLGDKFSAWAGRIQVMLTGSEKAAGALGTSAIAKVLVEKGVQLLPAVVSGDLGSIALSLGGSLVKPSLEGAVAKISKTAIGKAVTTVAAKAGAYAASAAVKLAPVLAGTVTTISETLAAIGAALGIFATPVFAIIGAAIGWIIGKVGEKIIPWLIENKDKIIPLFLAPVLIVGGAFAGGLLGGAMVVSGVGLGLGSLYGLGVAGTATAGAGLIGLTLTGFTRVVIPSIAKPIIITLITIPLFIAIIIFIINSGAYLVPPDSSLIPGLVDSPYVGVKKTPSPAGPFDNDHSPIVEYTIEIFAKQGTLTHIRFNYTCSVTKKVNPPDCLSIKPALPSEPASISPGAPFVFKYTQKYDSPGYNDSFIVDTFTVTADATEQADAVAAASATIKIGNPPEECPRDWPILPQPELGDSGSLGVTQTAYGSYSHFGQEALDIEATTGHNVTARHAGVITYTQLSGYGKYVEIKSNCSGKSFSTRYAHLSVILVKNGSYVKVGDLVGKSGNTGNSTGPHLHYEFVNLGFGSMAPPYIPKAFPRGCSSACGSVP